MLLIFFTPTIFGQSTEVNSKSIKLGESTVQLKIYKKSGKNVAYAHVHENETASLAAGIQMIEKYGGKLVTIAHTFDGGTNRNVTFKFQNTTYQFDPNRIYSQDLKVLFNSIKVAEGQGKVDDNVVRMVKNLADQLWAEIEQYPVIIALHNNKNTPATFTTKWLFWKKIEPESYSVKSYIKSFDESSDSNKSCSDIYINPALNNSEFFIVTEKRDFDMISQKRYTVVLQNTNPVDDGSMSVYASAKGKRYINSEAKMGRTEEQ
ncbi:MAG: hypothetical protein WAU01_07430, partial [Saprospiraceae bacterium]